MKPGDAYCFSCGNKLAPEHAAVSLEDEAGGVSRVGRFVLISSFPSLLFIGLLLSEGNQFYLILFGIFILWSIAAIQLRSAFRSLSRSSARDFVNPTRFLSLLAIAVLLVPPVDWGTVNSASGSELPSIQFDAWVGLLIILVTIVIICLFGGVVVGLWRVGSRYHSDSLKFATALYLLPVVNLVSVIIAFEGTQDILQRLNPERTRGGFSLRNLIKTRRDSFE